DSVSANPAATVPRARTIDRSRVAAMFGELGGVERRSAFSRTRSPSGCDGARRFELVETGLYDSHARMKSSGRARDGLAPSSMRSSHQSPLLRGVADSRSYCCLRSVTRALSHPSRVPVISLPLTVNVPVVGCDSLI